MAKSTDKPPSPPRISQDAQQRAREKSAARYAANAEKIKAAVARYRAANRDKCKARRAAWLAKNKKRARAVEAKWHAEHPEKQRAAQAKYRSAHRAKIKAAYAKYYVANRAKEKARKAKYYAAHPEQSHQEAARRRAKQRGASIDDKAEIASWERAWRKLKSITCYWCGRRFPSKRCQADHVVPLSKNGGHGLYNLVIACEGCNLRKNNKEPEEWNKQLPQPRLFV